DWGTEEWTRGAYAASFDLGGLARYGADQRASVGPIRFASSDLAGHGYQHVDGAVRIGRQVADEISAAVPLPAVGADRSGG
ncbi:MAG: FAD-dependent oxidoreductase, partial [Williamsia herbipolensis]|nr:FAD-dependent oxidoreductase [Williamsia herbipolensis]